jgi:septal ring factor EnvC (AmiA/AmiB activator)
MYLSQSKAAKVANVSRGTIANRIQDGKLSQTPEGIELSELMRVFDYINEDDIERAIRPGSARELESKSPSTPASVLEGRLEQADKLTEWLRNLVEQQQATIAEKERQLTEAQAEAQRRLDEREAFWTRQVTQLQALLPAPEQPRRKRFLGIF